MLSTNGEGHNDYYASGTNTQTEPGKGETVFTDGPVKGYSLEVKVAVYYTHPNGEGFAVSFTAKQVFAVKP